VVAAQALPHVPQFRASSGGVHIPDPTIAHHCSDGAQVSQRPLMHRTPAGHRLSHAPQFAASFVFVSHPFTLRPSQSAKPGRHPTREHAPDGEHSARALG
jgi:hypothetical protein